MPSRPMRAFLPTLRIHRAVSHEGDSRRFWTCDVVRVVAVPKRPWSGTLTWPPAGWSPTPLKAIGQGRDAWSTPPLVGRPHRPAAWSPEFGSPSHTANVWFGSVRLYVRPAPGDSAASPSSATGCQVNSPQPSAPRGLLLDSASAWTWCVKLSALVTDTFRAPPCGSAPLPRYR